MDILLPLLSKKLDVFYIGKPNKVFYPPNLFAKVQPLLPPMIIMATDIELNIDPVPSCYDFHQGRLHGYQEGLWRLESYCQPQFLLPHTVLHFLEVANL
jgi:hypothetical protein